MKRMTEPPRQEPIRLLSVVIPCRNEEGAIASTVEHLYVELRLHGVEHEIVPVDDGSTDSTWAVLQDLQGRVPTL
ncbi:MAG TPA: glycosyltransferase, partial [Bryobacteraceae bacterium]|nr:glycosyltransferase [Bryobacteraceae bacterium]